VAAWRDALSAAIPNQPWSVPLRVPPKDKWKATASGGDPRCAIDDRYATGWPLCRTRRGEGGQDVFAFRPTSARFVRWAAVCDRKQLPEIVEINLYGPGEAASVVEPGRIGALGSAPIILPAGQNITVDFGSMRSPLGVLIDWGDSYGTDFSALLSDDGVTFREMGTIATGDGDSDSFWWRSTTSRYFRLALHKASAPEGAVTRLETQSGALATVGRAESICVASSHAAH
jgi:hypothetical protein